MSFSPGGEGLAGVPKEFPKSCVLYYSTIEPWMQGERGGDVKPWAAQSYRAYLLRCWHEGEAAPGEAPAWRFSLEEVAGERRRRGFVSLEALVVFLRTELRGEPAGGGAGDWRLEIGDWRLEIGGKEENGVW
jgi:hypothetical protein